MHYKDYDTQLITDDAVAKAVTKLDSYRKQVYQMIDTLDHSQNESSLLSWDAQETIDQVLELGKQFKKVKHVVLIGIGGSSLGTEAIHSVLADESSPQLHILDTVSAFELSNLLRALSKVTKAEHLAVCVVSKSGGTTETLANASVLLEVLEKQVGKKVYTQTIFIGNDGNDLLTTGEKMGVHTLSMPTIVGGRYSVFTAVGLVPLCILGHDIKMILAGLEASTESENEMAVTESAARLFVYLNKGYNSVNFFAFDTRLVRLGKWYRQLTAESLGKEYSVKKKSVKIGFVPTISTPVELHSIGQLYFSGFKGVYTDFVSFIDTQHDYVVSKTTKIGSALKGKTLQEIHSAIEGGVLGAYKKRTLPFRVTQLDSENPEFALGHFMGTRMLETMYLANLMQVDAFNQPNVELYKNLTRKILRV